MSLRKPSNKLQIVSVSPSGIVKRGVEPITIELEVRTSKGAEDGKANCYYGFAEGEEIRFFTTGGTTHFQTFNTMLRGDYEFYITCKDASGEIAKNKTELSIELDTSSPIVVRTYHENNNLIVLTDEKAECYYDLDRCNFNLKNGTSMTTAFSETHSADWISGQTYYIKCADIWGNENSGCGIKVRAE